MIVGAELIGQDSTVPLFLAETFTINYQPFPSGGSNLHGLITAERPGSG